MADQEIREVGAKLTWAVQYEKVLREIYIDPLEKRIREGFFEAAKNAPAVTAFLNGVQDEIERVPDSTVRGRLDAIANHRLFKIAERQAADQRKEFVKAFAVVFGWEIRNVLRLIEPEDRKDLVKYLAYWKEADRKKTAAKAQLSKIKTKGKFVKKEDFEKEVAAYKAMADHLMDGAKKIEKDSALLIQKGFMKIIQERPMDQKAIMEFFAGKMKKRGLHLRMFTRSASTRYVGFLNMMRNKSLGIKKYRWVAVMDDRTRETHRQNHLKTFSWEEEEPGDAEGRPGFEWNCRCTSRPVIDDEVHDRITEMIAKSRIS